jgi:DNA-binding CsgD family transcriptional regulator
MGEARHNAARYLHELSPRQEDVLALVAKGHTNREIAERLGIAPDGVKWHVGEILLKLQVETREDAAEVWRAGRGRGAHVRRMFVALATWKVGVGIAIVVAAAGVAVVALGRYASGDGVGSIASSHASVPVPPLGDVAALNWQRGHGPADTRLGHTPQPAFADDPAGERVIAKVVKWLGQAVPEPQRLTPSGLDPSSSVVLRLRDGTLVSATQAMDCSIDTSPGRDRNEYCTGYPGLVRFTVGDHEYALHAPEFAQWLAAGYVEDLAMGTDAEAWAAWSTVLPSPTPTPSR